MKRAKIIKLAFDKKPALVLKLAADAAIKGAGIAILARDTGRMLFIKRSPDANHPDTFDFAGGKAEDGESPDQTARRETREEIGVNITGELSPMSDTTSDDDVNFITYYYEVPHEFTPKLDKSEHTEHVWAFPNDPPQPLHPGVAQTLSDELAKDANPLSIAAIRLGHKGGKSTSPAKVAASRTNGARHGSDAALAFDRESVRSVDTDGRLHVAMSNISKGNICPYLGSEIPDADVLGLDATRVYKLFRDPEELAKAAPTFNNIQLLNEHVPVSSTDHKPENTIGALGSDAVFEAPYLKNSLVIWTQEAIDRVNSGEAQEISCSYRYVADMTPGVYEGENYDGRMTSIIANHAALVPVGRAGKDCVVGDSALALPSSSPSRTNLNLQLEKTNMSQTLSKKALRVRGVLHAVLKPQFAADKMPDLDLILAGVDKKNYVAKKPLIVAAIKSHMAADAELSALVDLLDALDGSDKAEDEDDDVGVDADPVEGILAHCRGKLSDDEMSELESKVRAMSPAAKANDEPPAFKDEPKVGDKPAEDEEDDKEKDLKEAKTVSKAAMDSAIKVAAKAAEDRTIARINGIHEARAIAQPIVGDIAVACDSAEDVYRAALKIRGVDVTGVHPSAFRTILELQAAPAKVAPAHAHDSASVSGMDKFLSDLGLPA